MSELKAFEVTRKALFGRTCTEKVYLKSEADKVIAYKDKEIADLIEKNKRLARKDLIMASETINDLEESHKKEVGQLLMKIAELKKTLNNSRNARKYWRKEYLIEYKECCSQKYKRCLAMAERCLTEKVYWHYRYNDCGDKGYTREYKWRKVELWSKWAMRWLKIAEKFKDKEAK